MAQALDTETQKTTGEARLLVEREHRDRNAKKAGRSIDSFLSELRRMTPRERIAASRYSMTLHERSVYAARYPEEAPTLNGELEWITAYAE